MLIVRTPFRVSLFGGGTDIPEYFNKTNGQVISMAIDKYCYVNLRNLPEIFSHKIRFSYSKIETCFNTKELNHPLVKVALEDFNIDQVEIHYDADLPANSGLGTSSSFAVGLAHTLGTLSGEMVNKKFLIEKAIHWERNLLGEKGGYQDQVIAAYGGFNHTIFSKKIKYNVSPLLINGQLKKEIEERVFLIHVPIFRLSSELSVANQLTDNKSVKTLDSINEIATEALKAIYKEDLDEVGELIDQSWQHKKKLAMVTNAKIDEIYNQTKKGGALGAKLLGAGAGGFLLVWTKKGMKDIVKKSLKNLYTLDFKIDHEGSKLLYKGENFKFYKSSKSK